MAIWTRKPQEQDGNYFFSGKFYITSGVLNDLPLEEIVAICIDLRQFIKEKNGIDYLQVYTDGSGRKLFFIDQLNEEMIESGNYRPEDNQCTLLWAHEY